MNAETLLPLMKLDLGISSDAFDERLLGKLNTAIERIEAEGCTLSDSEADKDLVLMYAEWLWRERVSGNAMPRMVRWALNNRVLGPKAAAGGTS